MHGVPISKMSTCGATLAASATVASKSNESNAIWVCAMMLLPPSSLNIRLKFQQFVTLNKKSDYKMPIAHLVHVAS